MYDKVEAAQEQARSEQDLTAQQKAANSALLSALIAFATAILTGVGIIYIKRTLEATTQAVVETAKATQAMDAANDIARSTLVQTKEMNKAQLQPYVFVDRIELKRSETNPQIASITAILKNYGLTPALYIQPMIGWQILDYPLTKRPTHSGIEAETISEIAPQQETVVPHPMGESCIGETVWSNPKKGKALIVHVSARYENRLDTSTVSWSGFFIYDGPDGGFRRLAMFNDEKLGGFVAT